MELIILNIGLERGIITPTLFTMMVVMAIVTTLMASPIFEWVYGRHMKKAPNRRSWPTAPPASNCPPDESRQSRRRGAPRWPSPLTPRPSPLI